MGRPLDTDDFLAHFGVKGMKWGVRKAGAKEGVERQKAAVKKELQEKISRPRTDEAKTASAGRSRIKKHGTDALTNDELKALVTRMNLEEQYRNLSAKPSVRESGQKYVMDVLADVGKQLLTDMLVSGAQKGASAAAGAARNRYAQRGNPTDLGEFGAGIAGGLARRALTR